MGSRSFPAEMVPAFSVNAPPGDVLAAFCPDPAIAIARPLGNGNINTTFLLTEQSRRFVLQRINPAVFPDPERVAENFVRISDHLCEAARRYRLEFVCARPLATLTGEICHRDVAGECWRAQSYVDHCGLVQGALSGPYLEALGRVLGRFHLLTEDLPLGTVADPLPGFHITPRYLASYEQSASASRSGEEASLLEAMAMVEKLRTCATVLEQAHGNGVLSRRIIHGDPKLDNVIFQDYDQAVGLFDLDTAGPGLIHYDLGDCLRSACNPAGEVTHEWWKVDFDLDRCQAILSGYLQAFGEKFGEEDRYYLFAAVQTIAFELGLRFLTDHLQGDRYFRASAKGENLIRALVQLRLAQVIGEKEKYIRELVDSLSRKYR